MDSEFDPLQSTAGLLARQERLEQQVADLSRQVQLLERRLGVPAGGLQIAAPVVAPPPPLAEPAARHREAAAAGGRRASLESRLGSQVFNRVGIVALLIGVTWFLKLAVDNQWIGPTARILIGLVAGSALVLWSERFRSKGFAAFSYSLKAIGTGVLYLALWASFQLYHLLPAAAALGAMLLVTGWNAWMAWAQDAELLAAYALAGGMSTPLLLSTGGNHEVFLFTYLLSIDVACVALARMRGWPRLLPGALASTAAYFIGWYSNFYSPAELRLTAMFIVLFTAVFASVPLLSGRASGGSRARLRVTLEDVLLPLGTAAFAALALYSVLQDAGQHELLPWLMLVLSGVYLGMMRLPQSQLASAIHLSLAVLFLTIAIPLKASGAWIVVAWLVEGTALLWVSTRAFAPAAEEDSPGRLTLLLLASASLALGFVGVFYELFLGDMFRDQARQAFVNLGFMTAAAGLVAFAVSLWLIRAAGVAAFGRSGQLAQHLVAALAIGFNVVAVVAGVVQIGLLFRGDLANTDATLQRALAVSAFLMFYGGALLAVGFWKRSAFVRWQALVLLVFTVAKTFLYDMRSLSSGYRVLSFLGLGALLMAVSFAYQRDWLALRETATAGGQQRGPAE